MKLETMEDIFNIDQKIKEKANIYVIHCASIVYLDSKYNERFTIKDFCRKYLDKEVLKEHYAHLIDKPLLPELVDYMTSDKVAILLLEGDNIVESFRNLCVLNVNKAQKIL